MEKLIQIQIVYGYEIYPKVVGDCNYNLKYGDGVSSISFSSNACKAEALKKSMDEIRTFVLNDLKIDMKEFNFRFTFFNVISL